MSGSQFLKTHRHTVKSGQSQTTHTHTPRKTPPPQFSLITRLSDSSLNVSSFICLTFAMTFC